MGTPGMKRRTWEDDDKETLIRLWGEYGSTFLIARRLDRPEGSVQTEASRLNLDRRRDPSLRHRMKWTEQEALDLEAATRLYRTDDDRIKIIDVALSLGRTIDAVVKRLRDNSDDPEELDNELWIPLNEIDIRRAFARHMISTGKSQVDSRNVKRMRKCLTCQSPFFSEGAHNRICPRCKADDGNRDFYYT